jgi:aryl-alcohol dehydrogenase-like predicted oxidoreductase
MQYRAFNHTHTSPIRISTIGFGAMGISEFYGPSDEALARRTIQDAIASGINHFDTADSYGFGDNEKFLGKALDLSNPNRRSALIVASKAGILRDRSDPSVRGISIKPAYLQRQLHASLSNLGTDYLDIFYIHRLPSDASPASLNALATFLKAVLQSGRARSIGLSEPRLSQLDAIRAVCPVQYVQSEYSLLERIVEQNGVLAYCRRHGIDFVAYSPLCRGLLTDSFNAETLSQNDFRTSLPRFGGDNLVHNLRVVAELKDIASALNTTIAALAMAWLLHKEVLLIPGMRKPERIGGAMAALTVDLSHPILDRIESVLSASIKGGRYAPAAMMAYGFEDEMRPPMRP